MSDVAPEPTGEDAGNPAAPAPVPGDAAAAASAAVPASQAPPDPPAPPPPDPASTAGMLSALAQAIAPGTIDELWIFPPRRIGAGPSTIVVASVFEAGPDSDRRRIFTTRFTVVKGAKGQLDVRREMTEDGAAPAERVGRVVDGVVRRLDDEPSPPRHARIEGSDERWAELIERLREDAG